MLMSRGSTASHQTYSAEAIRKKWHPANWMPQGFREMWEHAIDLEVKLNSAEAYILDLKDKPAALTPGEPAPCAGVDLDAIKTELAEYLKEATEYMETRKDGSLAQAHGRGEVTAIKRLQAILEGR